ncbi:MAG TPA: PorP/SprF family type IX secretion system membrane protein [Bacteroidales bacterium]|nr:PorP/SprF family type IX secretion system membrane protein [Bacteroidales bacterium]
MKQFISIIAVMIFSTGVFAQDLKYSQFYHNKMLLNPAYTGLSKSLDITAHHRQQWMGVGDGNLFQSDVVSVDYGLSRKSSGHYGSGLGAGIIYQSSKTGTSAFTTREIGIQVASDAPRIGKERHGFMMQFPVGISFSYLNQSFDYSDLIFSDNLDPVLGYIPGGSSIPAGISQQAKAEYLSLGFGGLIGMKLKRQAAHTHYLSIGYAYKRYVDKPGTENSYSLPPQWKLHALYHQPIGDMVISPGYIYDRRGDFTTRTFGMQGSFIQGITLGLWLRNQNTKLISASYSDLIMNVTWDYQMFRFGYSYDMTISSLSNSSSKGTHELFVRISLYNDKTRRENKRRENSTCFFQGLN